MLFCTTDFVIIIPILVALLCLFILVCRWFIFKKMGIRPWISLIPIVCDYMIFKKCWRVWPFVVLMALTLALAFFVRITGYMDINIPIPAYIRANMRTLSLICLSLITIIKYKRIAFSFGHDILYLMGLLFLNPIFLGMLAFSKKNVFDENAAKLKGKELREYLRENRSLLDRVLSAVSAVIIVFASIAYISNIMMTEQQPSFMVQNKLNGLHEATYGRVSGMGQVVYPAFDQSTDNVPVVRDKYYPDKSRNTETTVYMYVIGSDLEDSIGAASANITQIVDSTAAGSNLKFVVEAGGSGRWFADGFKDRTIGRYLIKDGKVEFLESLPKDTCMSKPETLKEFLKWANNNYPSNRKMLFFWDHGSGLSGFGEDILNQRNDQKILSLPEIEDALEASGERYDVIGFDSCLMQTMEVGLCMEPYADYLLASEEVEPSSGFYYTAAFSRLAQEPYLDTVTFGSMMCSSYDQSLYLLNSKMQAGATISMTDLRYMPLVSDTFIGYLQGLDSQFMEDHSSFTTMSTARSKAYKFMTKDQIDLVDYFYHSDISADKRDEIVRKINKAIVVRNAGSANHINGLAVYMPYDDIKGYTKAYDSLRKLGMKPETEVYNDFASIIGSQKSTKDKARVVNVSKEKWYQEEFKNYNSSVYIQDVPLIQRGHSYIIDLSDEEWNTIIGCEQGLMLKVGKKYADLGSDNVLNFDENGHSKLEFDDTWVAINGVPVALHPGTPKEKEDGSLLFTGAVDATLNFTTPIKIYIQWDTDGNKKGQGTVLGYLPADEDTDDVDESGMPRGFKQFKSTSIVTFLYDWYDENGNYISTAAGYLPISVGLSGLKVSQKNISLEEYEYYGILKNIMNSRIETEKIHHDSH